jgi:hypothetical protein
MLPVFKTGERKHSFPLVCSTHTRFRHLDFRICVPRCFATKNCKDIRLLVCPR